MHISDNTTLYRPSILSFVITDRSMKKANSRERRGCGLRVLAWLEMERQRQRQDLYGTYNIHIEPFTQYDLQCTFIIVWSIYGMFTASWYCFVNAKFADISHLITLEAQEE